MLVYGPDVGLVRERVDALLQSVLKGEADPFRLSEIDSDILKSDPARLADEAAAMALTGGRRVVRIRDATDGITKTVEGFLEDPKGELSARVCRRRSRPRSSLRKLFEKRTTPRPCLATPTMPARSIG